MDYCNCGENKGRCIDCAEEQLAAVTKELSDVRAAAKAEIKRLFGDGETLRAALTTAREENERLTAENANLRAAVAGKTFFHSDEEVNAEMGRLRAEHESLVKELHLTRLALDEAAKNQGECVWHSLGEGWHKADCRPAGQEEWSYNEDWTVCPYCAKRIKSVP